MYSDRRRWEILDYRMDRHFRVAEFVANRLIDGEIATAVCLHGSVRKLTHRPDSDVDHVAVLPASTGL